MVRASMTPTALAAAAVLDTRTVLKYVVGPHTKPRLDHLSLLHFALLQREWELSNGVAPRSGVPGLIEDAWHPDPAPLSKLHFTKAATVGQSYGTPLDRMRRLANAEFAQLARAARLSPSQVHDIASGRAKGPPIRSLLKLAYVLDIPFVLLCPPDPLPLHPLSPAAKPGGAGAQRRGS